MTYRAMVEKCEPASKWALTRKSAVLRGANTLRVNTAFGGSFTAVDVGTGLVKFLAVCEVSLTPGSHHPEPMIFY
jgi:hypothetical protein